MQTNLSTSMLRKFFHGSGVLRLGGNDVNFWSYGKGILLRRSSGSLCRFSVIRTHSKQMFKPTGFLRSSNLSLVSEDRNFSLGGRSCGKFGSWYWSCQGHWFGIGQHWYQ